MTRPLYYDGFDLRTMSSSQADRVVYYLQVAYANQLDAAGDGAVYAAASGGLSIGSALDTSSTVQDATRAAPSDDGSFQSYPSYPGIGTETDTTYYYRQNVSWPNFPSVSVLDSASYLALSSADIQIANTSGILLSIINQALSAIKLDYVGAYYVSPTQPSLGGAGVWSDKGSWFVDSRYNNVGNTTYKLWLKKSLTTIPGSTDFLPMYLENNDLKTVQGFNENHFMIQDVLLPALTRRLTDSTIDLRYEIVSGVEPAGSRGSFLDTKYTQSTNTQFSTGSGYSEVYTSRSTPLTSGTTTTVNTYWLKYKG